MHGREENQMRQLGLGLLMLAASSALACGSSSSGGTSSSGSSSSTGHLTSSSSGSAAASSSGGSSAGASATGGSSSGGSATAGAASSSGGSSTGGAPDAGPTCLDASTFAAGFSIADTTFCAIAIYTADEAFPLGSTPSWGNHHGPLVITQDPVDGGVTLERWSVQTGTSALAKQSTDVAAGVPADAFLGLQANDLPFFGWTAIFWTGPGVSSAGTLDAIVGGAVAQSYTANLPYALAGLSDGHGQGRLLYSGLSPLGSPSTDVNGLYAADACSLPSQQLGGGTGCSASALISAWGDEPGPVAVDKAGNAFAVLPTGSSGSQEGRGFLAPNVARGQGATPGVPLFTIPGFSGSLAAIAPTSTSAGLLVFQPFDATTSSPLDVVEQAYVVASDVAAMGTTTKLLRIGAGATNGLAFMTDDSDRLWVAYTGASSTTYVVIDRAP